MKRLYEKNELTFAIVWIVIYCTAQSLANPLNERIGPESSASAIFCILQAAILFCFLKKNGLLQRYGLCKSSVPACRFLYYVPLMIIGTRNLWNGAAVNLPLAGTVCYITCMLCVGFVEEVIFRGFLFRAIAKDNKKTAVILSSVTFGLGHLLNLVNGSGMELAENLFQVAGAIAFGFLFVILFDRGGSLIPCIITHSVINASSTFANEAGSTAVKRIGFNLIMFVMIAVYTLVLTKTLPENTNSKVDIRENQRETI